MPVPFFSRALRNEGRDGLLRVVRTVLGEDDAVPVPVVVLLPAARSEKLPCVVAVAQEGREAFFKQRAEAIAELLSRGVAVCLPEVRGTGETSPGKDRGRQSAATALSSSELMLGNTLVGLRLKDLRTVIRWLPTLSVDRRRIAVWGDSFAAENGPDRRIDVPLGIGDEPALAEPLGPLLALLAGLFEDDVAAVVARGGLSGLRTALQGPFVYIPHDAVVPGALTAGDAADLAGALSPRPVFVQRCVDATNRAVDAKTVRAEWAAATAGYRGAGAGHVRVAENGESFVEWLVGRLE